ncbi:uncharacterized protein SAPINGB_P000906 [Magnusiomyces paraingens]|uniref:3-ketoacyl-CoA reductase n=1 Tax=Magnusiomyces paraingens TaxID=2606893 RepID=A0A5E8B966_9ASCO|nr:uncharacterized protein SAPINGB_P000906 [Saprochaete ingens]VVT45818.1 unnamed protein product [Saprochaete ingens]
MTISLDSIVTVLQATVLSPTLCWAPLILRSGLQLAIESYDLGVQKVIQAATYAESSFDKILFTVFLYIQTNILPWSAGWKWYLVFCFVVTACWDILVLDTFLARRRGGHATFLPDPKKDAVVVTGGGLKDGLGRAISKWFQKRGFFVIVLDIQWQDDTEKDELLPKIQFAKCNVAEYEEVAKVFKDDLKSLLPEGILPSILINNAGVTHNKFLIDIDPETVKRTISVNLLAPFWTCKALLSQVFASDTKYRGASIVNVGSVLGTIGCPELTAYCASKGGIRLFHDCLLHEVGEPYYSASDEKPPVNVLLVTPGQLDTSMFKTIDTPSTFIAPLVRANDLAHEIGAAIVTGQTGVLSMPFYTRISWAFWALPSFITEGFRKITKMDDQMQTFGKKRLIGKLN